MERKIIFFSGSPKPAINSACSSIVNRFIRIFLNHSFVVYNFSILQILISDEEKNKILKIICDAENIVFVTPLYLDTVPSFVIMFMEFLMKNRSLIGNSKNIFAVSVCGFPEASHNDSALRIFRRFSDEIGFKWVGGIGIGQSFCYLYGKYFFSLIGRYRPLDEIILSLRDAIINSSSITKKIINPVISNFLYVIVATVCARIIAIKNGRWSLCYRKNSPIQI